MPNPLTASATSPGAVLAPTLAAVAVGVGTAELAGATRLLAGLASSALLLPLVALVAAALGAATGALLAEAQEAVGHATHLLRTRDTSVTNGDGRLSGKRIITYLVIKSKH
jgi:hypothetical protein